MNEQHEQKIRARGVADGTAAASWFFDREVSGESYREVLKGIEDGDPMIMDSLPFPDLSGQWAEGDTAESIVREEIGDEIEQYLVTESNERVCVECDARTVLSIHCGVATEASSDLVQWYELDDLISAYEAEYSSAAEAAIAKECRFHLEPV